MTVAKHFLKRQKKITLMFVSSITSNLYGPKMASYISSKHGL